jgi:hypothetical protein
MRTRARRRPLRGRCRVYGKEFGQGKRQEDAVSGWEFPVKDMVRQRGGLVSSDPSDESLDKPDTY